jgi:hypothetical protein
VTLSLAVQARGYKEVPPYHGIESSGDHGTQVKNALPGAARSTNDWRIIALLYVQDRNNKLGPPVSLKMHSHTAYSYFIYVCIYLFIYLFMIPSTMHITSFYQQSTYSYFLDHHNGTNSKLTNMNF